MNDKIVSKTFLSLFAQNFLVFSGYGVLNVLPDHLASIGASKLYISLFMNIGGPALVLAIGPISRYADRIGRKRLMLVSYAAALVSSALSFAFGSSPLVLALARPLSIGLFCLVFTIQGAEVFGLFPRERRMSGLALFGISGIAGNPVGTIIGERLLSGPGGAWLFLAILLLNASAMVLAGFYPYSKGCRQDQPTSLRGLMRQNSLRPLFALTFMLGGAWAVYATFLANHSRERLGVVSVSLFYSAFSVVAILIRFFLGRTLERRPPYVLLSGCFAVIAVSFALTIGLRAPLLLIPIGVLYGVGHSILFPLIATLFVNSGSDDDRMGLNNLFSATNAMGGIITAFAMGALADATSIPVVFAVMVAATAAMVPIAILGTRGRPATGA